MNLPNKKECYKLFNKFHTPQTIINHSLAVNKVSNYLALKIKQKGIVINLDLVDRASLLHDLLRICDIPKNKFSQFPENKKNNVFWEKQWNKHSHHHHAKAAAEELQEKYPELAQAILEHAFEYLDNFSSLESKIVHYADKRVDFDKIVSLDKRLEEGLKRWNIEEPELKKTWDKLCTLEKEIFTLIKQDPNIITTI